MHPLEQLEGLSSGRQEVAHVVGNLRTQCLDCSMRELGISQGVGREIWDGKVMGDREGNMIGYWLGEKD